MGGRSRFLSGKLGGVRESRAAVRPRATIYLLFAETWFHRDPLAPLRAAPGQDKTPSLGAHARPKPVGLLAPMHVRLKGSLHRSRRLLFLGVFVDSKARILLMELHTRQADRVATEIIVTRSRPVVACALTVKISNRGRRPSWSRGKRAFQPRSIPDSVAQDLGPATAVVPPVGPARDKVYISTYRPDCAVLSY